MLTRTERTVAKTVIGVCGERESCLVPEKEFLSLCKMGGKDLPKLRKTLNSLSLDGYFDLIRCVKDKEETLCFIPKHKLLCYKRERREIANGIAIKILLAVLGSVTAFIVTKILYGLF